MAAKDKFLADMRREKSAPGFIGSYLAFVRETDPKAADFLETDLALTFTSENGLRVLKMLEKSVLTMTVPNGSSDCALRELNATRNLVAEIRRIVAHVASN